MPLESSTTGSFTVKRGGWWGVNYEKQSLIKEFIPAYWLKSNRTWLDQVS